MDQQTLATVGIGAAVFFVLDQRFQEFVGVARELDA